MVDLQRFAYKATAFALVLIRESVAKKNIFNVPCNNAKHRDCKGRCIDMVRRQGLTKSPLWLYHLRMTSWSTETIKAGLIQTNLCPSRKPLKSFNFGKQRGSCWRNNSRRSVTAMLAQAKHKNITHVTGTYSRAGSTTIPLVPPPLAQEDIKGTCCCCCTKSKNSGLRLRLVQLLIPLQGMLHNCAQEDSWSSLRSHFTAVSPMCQVDFRASMSPSWQLNYFYALLSSCIEFIRQKELLLTEVHFIAESGQSPPSRTTRYTLVLATATMV